MIVGLLRSMLVALMLFAFAPAQAQTFPKLANAPVVDAANVIPDADEAALNQTLLQFTREKGQQFVVATVPDLQGYSIEDYGYRLGRNWAIGLKEIDDGVILLVAPNERKVRIEVGYGLTPVLTAQLSGFIISDTILPKFRDGDMPGGINAGADAILTQLRLPAPQAEARAKRILAEQSAKQGKQRNLSGLIPLLFWLAVLAFLVLPVLFGRRRGRKYRKRRGGAGPVILWGPGWGSGGSSGGSSDWGGGGFGGGGFGGGSSGGGFGGFSGGGGSFGGGGASGGW